MLEGGRRPPSGLGVGRLFKSGGRFPGRPPADSCRRSCLRPVAWHGGLRQKSIRTCPELVVDVGQRPGPGTNQTGGFVARVYRTALRPARSDGPCMTTWAVLVFSTVRQPVKGFGGRLAWAGSAHGDARIRSSQRESDIGELPVSVFEGQAICNCRQCCVCPSRGRSIRPHKHHKRSGWQGNTCMQF